MVDKSSNAEAAHLWKALSEDEIKSLIEVIDEFGKLVHPSKCEVPLMDLVVIIFKEIVIVVVVGTMLLAETLKMTSCGQTNFDAERLGNHAVDHVEKLSTILIKGTQAIQSRASIKSCRLHGSHIYRCREHHEDILYLKF
ncbi:hypothetical protein DAPPUDRAFT_315263 [Daphnia pulex]|uniref:Uncharacterized protein n=1 Tax=Daphnia pulex TaxID=6669 RepID=E9G984_DAPPU|nr:hypothetical protein DAPPUDRAFT_315263 [Daphnia pulex]|eukprot:EFX84131.1 hypothetical protein DAPPUDRAFT_315263 [Daphnia pulex]